MDVADLRQRILRALDAARGEPVPRRVQLADAEAAYEVFLRDVAVPLLRQAQSILRAEGHPFSLHTPAGSVRLAAEAHPDVYLELGLETAGIAPQIVCRISVVRGRAGVIVEERAIAPGKTIEATREEDVVQFLVAVIPQLVRV